MVFYGRHPVIGDETFLRGVVMAGRELMDLLDARQRHGTQFGTEEQVPVLPSIIKGFDADGVSGHHEVLPVKNGKGEHAVQL